MAEETVRETRAEVIEALQLAKRKDFAAATTLLKKGLDEAGLTPEERAVLCSTLGLVHKMEGKLDQAWEAYQEAEQQLPDDPLLKIIITRFLINDRSQYDVAIRKGKQIILEAKDIPSLAHQAYALLGLAYLKKGNKHKASELLDKAMRDNFSGIASAENIDFQLVEAFLRRNYEVEKCKRYIIAAANLARERREYKLLTVFQKLLDSLETTVV